MHESCFGGARALVPVKLDLRGDVGLLVVDRSSIGHPDLSLTRPRLQLEEVNVQGREGGKFSEGGGGWLRKKVRQDEVRFLSGSSHLTSRKRDIPCAVPRVCSCMRQRREQ